MQVHAPEYRTKRYVESSADGYAAKAVATATLATMRSTPELDSKLKARFIAALEKAAGGNADAFGRMLGHMNGGYVRQIVSGDKPVRESIIERVHALDGYSSWFSDLFPPLVAADIRQRATVDLFGPQPSLAAQAIGRRFDAIQDVAVKDRLYALLMDEIRIASEPSPPPVPAPTRALVPTAGSARGKRRDAP